MVAPMRRRFAVPFVCKAFQVSQRRACRVFFVCRASIRYRSVRVDHVVLRNRIKELAAARVRYGYRRLHVLLAREGWVVNHKRVFRVYREEGLSMRQKPPRRCKAASVRTERPIATAVNQSWSMDFMADNLCDGKRSICLQ